MTNVTGTQHQRWYIKVFLTKYDYFELNIGANSIIHKVMRQNALEKAREHGVSSVYYDFFYEELIFIELEALSRFEKGEYNSLFLEIRTEHLRDKKLRSHFRQLSQNGWRIICLVESRKEFVEYKFNADGSHEVSRLDLTSLFE